MKDSGYQPMPLEGRKHFKTNYHFSPCTLGCQHYKLYQNNFKDHFRFSSPVNLNCEADASIFLASQAQQKSTRKEYIKARRLEF